MCLSHFESQNQGITGLSTCLSGPACLLLTQLATRELGSNIPKGCQFEPCAFKGTPRRAQSQRLQRGAFQPKMDGSRRGCRARTVFCGHTRPFIPPSGRISYGYSLKQKRAQRMRVQQKGVGRQKRRSRSYDLPFCWTWTLKGCNAPFNDFKARKVGFRPIHGFRPSPTTFDSIQMTPSSQFT